MGRRLLRDDDMNDRWDINSGAVAPEPYGRFDTPEEAAQHLRRVFTPNGYEIRDGRVVEYDFGPFATRQDAEAALGDAPP